jgi:hypothetical protein
MYESVMNAFAHTQLQYWMEVSSQFQTITLLQRKETQVPTD